MIEVRAYRKLIEIKDTLGKISSKFSFVKYIILNHTYSDSLAQSDQSEAHLLPNKDTAFKNMKPKKAYLLDSPGGSEENSEEEVEEEDSEEGKN